MCASLHSGGYWADFIDPSSGKPVRNETSSSFIASKRKYIIQNKFQLKETMGTDSIVEYMPKS